MTTPRPAWMDDDALIAAVDMIGRAGARDLDIGHNGEDDSRLEDVRWHAYCTLRQPAATGVRVIEDGHPNPVAAVEALASRLLTGGTCTHCGGLIALSDEGAIALSGARMADGTTMTEARARSLPQCRYRREGKRWHRGCEGRYPRTPSGTVTVTGPTRRERREARRGGRRG